MKTTIPLICVLLSQAVSGFTVGSIPKGAAGIVPFRQKIKMTPSTVTLRARKQESKNEEQEQVEEEMEKPSNSNVLDLFKKGFEFVIMRALDVTSFAFTFVGVASFCGLLLNVMGYGYHIGRDFTVEIDTLEHMRLQNEFQREIMRSMHDVA